MALVRSQTSMQWLGPAREQQHARRKDDRHIAITQFCQLDPSVCCQKLGRGSHKVVTQNLSLFVALPLMLV